MSQVDITVYFSLLYQFIILFVIFYLICSAFFLPSFIFIMSTRLYFYNSFLYFIIKYISLYEYLNKELIYLTKKFYNSIFLEIF